MGECQVSASVVRTGTYDLTQTLHMLSTGEIDTAGGNITVPAYSSAPDADQPGPKANINVGDPRFGGGVVLNNGELWGIHTINVGGRAGVRWYRIDESTNTLIESGLIVPGTVLTDAKRRYSAIVRADGTLASGNDAGSIHRLGAKVQGLDACNGWTFWHYAEGKELKPIDALRAVIRSDLAKLD